LQDLPRLTIELIKASCSQRSFERGEEYYRNGAIVRPNLYVSEEDSVVILTAECEGTSDQNYKVSVFLSEDGISNANCSCPYDWGGYCKHIVALLLVYLNERERFSEEAGAPPDFGEIVAKLIDQEKENLVLLILAFLKEEPELLQLIRSFVACFQGYLSAKFLDESVIKETYLLYVEIAFGREFVQEKRQKEAMKKLNAMKASAQRKARGGDFYYAALILKALVLGCLNRYEDAHNPEEIFQFVSECVSLLQVALSKADLKKEKRQQWLLEIFERRNQIGMSFSCYSQNAENCNANCLIKLQKRLDELILIVCEEEDVPILLPLAQLKKEQLDKERAEASYCSVEHRNIVRFLLGLYEIAKRTEDYMKLAYSEGEGFLYVQKLIERKEIDKAIKYIQPEFSGN